MSCCRSKAKSFAVRPRNARRVSAYKADSTCLACRTQRPRGTSPAFSLLPDEVLGLIEPHHDAQNTTLNFVSCAWCSRSAENARLLSWQLRNPRREGPRVNWLWASGRGSHSYHHLESPLARRPPSSCRPPLRPTPPPSPTSSVQAEDSCFDLQTIFRLTKDSFRFIYSVLSVIHPLRLPDQLTDDYHDI